MLAEASQRERPFDAVLVDGTPGWADRLSTQAARVISVADLPRPVHPADLLAALRRQPGGSFQTDVYEAVRESALRVCVVDLGEEGTARLEEAVTDLNFEFLLAGDASEAWDLYQEEPVDLIVGEWKTCEELVKRVRDEGERPVMLAMVTTSDKEAKKARKLGADATLSQPVERDALTRLLRKLAREGARKPVLSDG
jgi:CheY-like chemotaxis protein